MFILIRWDVKREREDSTLIHKKTALSRQSKCPASNQFVQFCTAFSFTSKNSDSFLYRPCGAHTNTQLGECTTLCSQCNARMLYAQSQKVWRCITLRYSYFNHMQGEISIRDAKSDMRTAEMHYYYIIFINSPAEAAAFFFCSSRYEWNAFLYPSACELAGLLLDDAVARMVGWTESCILSAPAQKVHAAALVNRCFSRNMLPRARLPHSANRTHLNDSRRTELATCSQAHALRNVCVCFKSSRFYYKNAVADHQPTPVLCE
jgi:hypothetical protein